jgi:hypothetical protein
MDPTQNHNNGAPIIVVVLDLVLSFSPMVSALIDVFFFLNLPIVLLKTGVKMKKLEV